MMKIGLATSLKLIKAKTRQKGAAGVEGGAEVAGEVDC